MAFIITGTHLFGAVDRVPGLGHVATQFAHVNYLPLLPLGTFIVLEGSEQGDAFRGKRVRLSWKSVLVGYYRGWAGFAAVTLFALAGAMSPLFLGVNGHPAQAIAFVAGL